MPLSWNEIRDRAIQFSKEWKDARSEQAEKQSFWNDFFEVFGIKRRMVASFENPVRRLSGTYGFIDLFWKGMLLVEHKSRGQSLDKAQSQAADYIQSLISEGRQEECPRYIIISDFEFMALHDLEENTSLTFRLDTFYNHIHAFGFIPGYRQQKLGAVEDPINVRAVELMGELHDVLETGGYTGHDLERFLVRILFCLFADDTGIFERNGFTLLIENHTKEDGSDLGPQLAQLFYVLNTPLEKRQKNLPEDLATLPYVNGELFVEQLGFASFNRAMRAHLLKCCRLDWSRISPAVFGSLFQSVMEPKERRQIGAHYTSERDILKLINSLFMDDLRAEYEKVKSNKNRLGEFHDKLGRLKFLDPACGCGNFLVVTYRELRLLELEVLKTLYKRQQVTSIDMLLKVDIDAVFGIEINEFPALIAEVAMWLVDHQMNQRISEEFGRYYVRLPLRKSAKIVLGNALRIDWKDVIKPSECSYILGNPPFIGAKYLSEDQKQDMAQITQGVKNAGLLDYVTAWYFKAADFIKGTEIQVAFVSTNSISQGEQVGVLWAELFRRGIKINFAHRTFVWQSEAKKKAHVHVVIIGFGNKDKQEKFIFDYDADNNEIQITKAKNISPYLIEGNDMVIKNREKPLCHIPEIGIGNKPIDNGNYLFTLEEKNEFLEKEPQAEKYFRKWYGADEFINGWQRWCLWLGDCSPNELRSMPESMKRIENTKKYRLNSKSPGTRALASKPSRFHVENFPVCNFLVIPGVSSEKRNYIPIGFMTPEVIISNLCNIVPNATLFNFGVILSTMHMAWVRQVCGRLESRYRYSNNLVYNNFPWPQSPTSAQKAKVEAKAQAVLDARAAYPDASLADLYDPLTMPPSLVKAHAELDKAVEQCYRSKPFTSDRERVEFLFALYEQLTQPLELKTAEKPKRRKKSNET